MERSVVGNFKSPQEEIAYLRSQLAEKGVQDVRSPEGMDVARQAVEQYVAKAPEAVLTLSIRF